MVFFFSFLFSSSNNSSRFFTSVIIVAGYFYLLHVFFSLITSVYNNFLMKLVTSGNSCIKKNLLIINIRINCLICTTKYVSHHSQMFCIIESISRIISYLVRLIDQIFKTSLYMMQNCFTWIS